MTDVERYDMASVNKAVAKCATELHASKATLITVEFRDEPFKTIIRVERNEEGDVEGTIIFHPDKAKLDDGHKENLKLLNICDPYVAEFLFGGKVLVVEGDTKYTASNYIKS